MKQERKRRIEDKKKKEITEEKHEKTIRITQKNLTTIHHTYYN